MSDELKLYNWNPFTARKPRRVGMFRSFNYIELSVGLAAASLVVWISTHNGELFVTVFGFAYFLAVAHACHQSRNRSKDEAYKERSEMMEKIYNIEEKVERCSERKCADSLCKTALVKKADF